MSRHREVGRLELIAELLRLYTAENQTDLMNKFQDAGLISDNYELLAELPDSELMTLRNTAILKEAA